MLRRTVVSCVLLALCASRGAQAQQDFSQVEIKTEKLAEGVYVLFGAGGNIGVSAGEDGVFLVDDQYAPLTEKILAAVAAISDRPIRFVLNTHWHGDHTGGNENLGQAGVLIFAADRVRERMSTEQFLELFDLRVPASPKGALPFVTFNDTVTFHMNGEPIHVFHVQTAHTDGDSIVHFRSSDVVHMGDTFFNGNYPFIDVVSGGSIEGVIAAAERVLALSGPATRIIPGHGPVGGKAELEAYLAMLTAVRDRIQPMVQAGQSEDEVVAAKPTAEYDEAWGTGWMKPETFVRIVYAGLKASSSAPS
jgi:cyclase